MVLIANQSHDSNEQEHSQKHCKAMKEILINAWCRTSEQEMHESTTSTVEVDEADSKLITYTERFKMYLGDDGNQNSRYSNWFEINCEASKLHPSLIARVLLPIHKLNELDALKLANSINNHSSCAISVNDKGQFRVNYSISFVGYFDVDDATFDHPVAQSEATMNMFAELLSTSLKLHRAALQVEEYP